MKEYSFGSTPLTAHILYFSWKVWRHFYPQKLSRVQFCVLLVFNKKRKHKTQDIRDAIHATASATRGEFVTGADHMEANEAVPTIWDRDYMV